MPMFKAGEFGAAWRLWWEGLQPSWCQQETWPLSHDLPADGGWEVLKRGSINSIFRHLSVTLHV